MLIDVNVIVYAARQEFGQHELARSWLQEALVGAEPVAVLDEVLCSVVRVLTNHRILESPLTGEQALAVCAAVRGGPAAITPKPTADRWGRFARLTAELGLRANCIPDAFLAATALDLGASVTTFDRGFRRFPGLQVAVLA